MIHHCSPKSESLSGSTTMPCGSNILSHTTNRTAWQRADAVGALSQTTGARKKSRERAEERGGSLHPSFRAYSYYNRTGGNDDDERPINGHTAAHPATASELCINGNVGFGRKITWGPGLRACKGPLIRGRHGPTTARSPARCGTLEMRNFVGRGR